MIGASDGTRTRTFQLPKLALLSCWGHLSADDTPSHDDALENHDRRTVAS